MILTLQQIKQGTGFDKNARFETVEPYNGWTNRETWAVALYINNDQGLQESVYETLTNLTDDEGESLIVKVDWTLSQTRDAGEAIKDFLDELFDLDTHDGILPRDVYLMVQDIGSLWRVNWDELGASFLRDVSQS